MTASNRVWTAQPHAQPAVYKFSTPTFVESGHRTCTLYLQYNLPSDVGLNFNLKSTLNENVNVNVNAAEIIQLENHLQQGAVLPQPFKQIDLDTIRDNEAFSGYVHLCFLT